MRRLVRGATARPALTVALGLLAAVVGVVYTFAFLTLQTSTRELLPQHQPYIERYSEYDREFGDLDDITIVVEAPTLAESTEYAARLVHELRARRVPLSRIAYRVDPKQFEGRALLYMSKQQLMEIRERIFDYQEFMEAFAGRPTLDQLVHGIATQVASGFVTGFFDLGVSDLKASVDMKFVDTLAAQISERLDHPTPYRSPWGALFSVDQDVEATAGYFLSDDQHFLFVLAEPVSKEGSFTSDREAIDGIRETIASLHREFRAVRVGVTGKPAIASDEMTAAFSDSERATIVAFALTLLLLLVAFLRFGKPMLMLAVLAVSLGWSIGVATLVIGHLSLFSVMFISIVIGIGIDYGIYYLFRYEEEIFLGRNLREAIEITAARTGPGMLFAAATAAGTFYVLMATDFRGLQELGFIAGSAILLSWLAMMTVFPAILVLVDRHHAERPAGSLPRAIALESMRVPLVDHITRHPKIVLAIAALATVLSLWALRSIRFDYNLLNLQAAGTESVTWERRILQRAGRSGFAALASATSTDELRRKVRAFEQLKTVADVDSALMLIPDDQEEKQKIIRDFAPLVAPVRVGRPRPVELARLVEELETLRRRLDIGAREAPPGDTQRSLARTTDELGRLLLKLRESDPAMAEPVLTNLQYQLYRDFVRNFQRLQANLSAPTVELRDLPAEIRDKFISRKGRFLIQIHPAVDIWERDGATRFVNELRAVDPDVTGTPVITYEAIVRMERAYQQGTVYAILLVTAMTFFMLRVRRWRESLLALLPLGLGLLWTIGIMDLLRLKFTMGNVFALPLIIGAGSEYGINVMLRFIEGRDVSGPLIARSTAVAVLVNGLTTIVGFGSLMLAHHRGIYGLGLLLSIGNATSLVAALIVLPVCLRLVHRPPRPERRPLPESATPVGIG